MNCCQSCLSERSCRRCMYRYARAMRTLRAVVCLRDSAVVVCTGTPGRRGLSEPLRLCLLCMQLSSCRFSFLPKTHTGLAFLSDVRAVVFVLAEEPVSARAKLSFLRGVVCLGVCFCFASSASSKCARRGHLTNDGGPRRQGTVCLRDCQRPARYRFAVYVSLCKVYVSRSLL